MTFVDKYDEWYVTRGNTHVPVIMYVPIIIYVPIHNLYTVFQPFVNSSEYIMHSLRSLT